jgi:transcriptional regulator with XRE-family HTH domain
VPVSREDIAAQLRDLREQHDPPLTQTEAAELIGISVRRYADWELRKSRPSLKNIQRIAEAYNVPTARLLPPGDSHTLVDASQLNRVERMLELLLDHFDILPAGADMPDAPPEIADLEHQQPARRRRRG